MTYDSDLTNRTKEQEIRNEDVHNMLAEASRIQALKYWPCILLIVLCMVVGIVGNAGVCIVYAPKARKSNANVFILQLAVYDLVVCSLVLPFTIAMLARTFTFESPFFCKANLYLQYTFTGASLIVLIAIAVDRYFKVCRPLKPGISLKMAKMIRWTSLVGGAITTALVPYLYDITEMVFIDEHEHRLSGKTCGISSSVIGSIPHSVHVAAILIIFITIYAIMIILYVLVGGESWRRRRIVHANHPLMTSRMSENGLVVIGHCATVDTSPDYNTAEEGPQTIVPNHSRIATVNTQTGVHDIWQRARNRVQTVIKQREMRIVRHGTTMMLFLVSLVFLASWLPFWIIVIEETMETEELVAENNSTTLYRTPDSLLVRTGRSLFLINHAVNPIIYSLVSQTFRTEFAFRSKKIWRRIMYH